MAARLRAGQVAGGVVPRRTMTQYNLISVVCF